MPEKTPEDENKGTKGVSVYIPIEFHNDIKDIVKREGYMNVSDFMRDASRRLVQFYKTRYHSQIVNYLLESGTIKAADIHEAIQFIVTHEP